jgi:hypothetical protein
MRTCGDCHSNETVWPCYSNIAPISWLIQNDVQEGRENLNVSEWEFSEYDAWKSAGALWDGEMPPRQYKLLHAKARLSDSELHELYSGLLSTFGMGESGGGSEEGEN